MRWSHMLQATLPAPGGLQVSKLLQYSPVSRTTALGALTHPFFDELRDPSTTLPNGEGPFRGCSRACLLACRGQPCGCSGVKCRQDMH